MHKKRFFRLTAILLAVCLLTALLPSAALAAETTVSPDGDLLAAIEKANPGDTIHLTGTCVIGSIGTDGSTSDDRPLVIDKDLTIEGGCISLGSGGIILGGNVTFRNITLKFGNSICNAIMANGYTLTLDEVTCDNYSVNLFAGGLYDVNYDGLNIPETGSSSKIVVSGKTSLQGGITIAGSGNIYAGNLCMGDMSSGNGNDGPANAFNGSAEIDLSGAAANSKLGSVYAGGAQQRVPAGADSGKETKPGPGYTVTGNVDVTLGNYGVDAVDGAGCQGTTTVQYDGSSGSSSGTVLKNIDVLTRDCSHK